MSVPSPSAPFIRVRALQEIYDVPDRDAGTLLTTIGLAVAFVVGSRLFRRYGLRHYTGASA